MTILLDLFCLRAEPEYRNSMEEIAKWEFPPGTYHSKQ